MVSRDFSRAQSHIAGLRIVLDFVLSIVTIEIGVRKLFGGCEVRSVVDVRPWCS